MFKYATIDPAKSTPEEIRSEIERLEMLSNEFKNEEQAIKLALNSIYGALGNQWLVCFNPDVAETITLQGQNIIKHAESSLNKYFNEFWHKDTELHAKLGLTEEVKEVKAPIVIYMDTDSCFISFEEIIKSCNWKDSPKKLILDINKYRLSEYLNTVFDKYATKWNTKNYMDFELENISESAIWLAKKKYMTNVVWESGIDIESKSQIIYKGVELAQKGTPPFAREKLKELVKYILDKKRNLKTAEITKILRDVKAEFKLADPEKISMGKSVNDYAGYIRNDSTKFEVEKGCPIQIRAAGYHNFIINTSAKYKGKYQLIRGGDKIKFYHVKVNSEREEDIFGYIPGMYPYEVAPPIDYDLQFAKTIIDPINRIMTAMKLSKIPSGLQIAHALF